MVVFACNNCGESLKKNQVEKHSMQSRGCVSFSCMDCCKDFTLTSYKLHASCVSEAQRYQGSLYEGPEDGESKGAKKQKQWIEQLKGSIASAENLSPRVSALLSAVADYPNVPRKQKKFENFVSNSLRERNPKIIQQVWEAFSGQSKKQDSVSNASELIVTEKPLETENEEISGKDPKIESEELVLSEEQFRSEKKKKKKRRDYEIETNLLPNNPKQECELETKKKEIKYISGDIHIPDTTTVDELETEIKVKKKKRVREEIETHLDIKIKKSKTETEIKHKKKKNKHKHLEQ